MAHLIKTFYKTTQEALHEASTYRKRNERLDYALNSAIDKVQVANAEMAALKAELKVSKSNNEKIYKDGYNQGVIAVNKELKLKSN